MQRQIQGIISNRQIKKAPKRIQCIVARELTKESKETNQENTG
jgi:hypothetical protein